MLPRLRARATYANVGVTAALVLGATGWALAATPSSSKVLHGCYGKRTGILRVVSGTKCRKGEKAISWNQKGPQGLQGRQGPMGNPGPAGTATAYAAFAADGTISPGSGTANPIGGSAKGLAQSDETGHVTATGVYCFHPSFTPQSAMVSAIGDLGLATTSFIVATVDIRTNHNLSGCGTTDTVRVRTYEIPSGGAYVPPALKDEPFILWLE
jgi:hypothetical protein